MDTPQNTQQNMGQGTQQNKTLMAVLAYIGPFIIISYLTSKDDPFVKFHIKQGLVLFVIEVATWFIMSMLWQLWFLIEIINFGVFVLAIIGIINASQGKQQELPVVGKYSSYFSI